MRLGGSLDLWSLWMTSWKGCDELPGFVCKCTDEKKQDLLSYLFVEFHVEINSYSVAGFCGDIWCD